MLPPFFVKILTAKLRQMTLKLQNNLTKKVHTFNNLEDKLASRMFYTFDITLPEDVDDGEYTYSLLDENGNVKASGLAQIGDYAPQNNTYAPQTQNGYVQYNSNN